MSVCYLGCWCRGVGFSRKSFFWGEIGNSPLSPQGCLPEQEFIIFNSQFSIFNWQSLMPPLCLRSASVVPPFSRWELERTYSGLVTVLQRTHPWLTIASLISWHKFKRKDSETQSFLFYETRKTWKKLKKNIEFTNKNNVAGKRS